MASNLQAELYERVSGTKRGREDFYQETLEYCNEHYAASLEETADGDRKQKRLKRGPRANAELVRSTDLVSDRINATYGRERLGRKKQE